MYCDAEAARAVFRSQVTKTLIPIDLTSRMTLNFDLLDKLPDGDSRAVSCCGKLLPGAFRAYRQQLGMEGIHLHDAVAIVAAMQPELFTTERMYGDVETEGTLTYGATVFDRRRHAGQPAEHGRGHRHGHGGGDGVHPARTDASGVKQRASFCRRSRAALPISTVCADRLAGAENQQIDAAADFGELHQADADACRPRSSRR